MLVGYFLLSDQVFHEKGLFANIFTKHYNEPNSKSLIIIINKIRHEKIFYLRRWKDKLL